jgi:2-phosphosulfolactate phosphatase (EC 3.1.3.71)
VVIDVLRATSAICSAFQHGVKALIPVPTIEEAKSYQEKG